MYILKKSDNSFRRSISSSELVINKLRKGSINDHEINLILDSGDRKMKNELERITDRKEKEAKHVHRLYGNDFDGRDNDGNLYKDVRLGSIDRDWTKKNSRLKQSAVNNLIKRKRI